MNKRLRRYVHLALASLIAVSSVSVTFASEFIVNESFDNMILGAAPSGYEVSDSVAITTVDLNNDRNYCVYLNDGEGQLKMNKQFAAQSEVVTLSVDFMQNNLGSGTHINLTDGTGLRAVRLETRDNGTSLNYVMNGTYVKVADITSGEWMTIKIEANIKTQTFNIYINDILKGKDIPFKNTVSEISYFQTLTPADKVSGHYIDNLSISASKAPVTIPEDATEITFTVNANGQGDFKTVQEAIDAIPSATTLPATIHIKAGTYKEVVTIPKSVKNLTLIGEGSEQTILTYDNYNAKLKEDGTPYGTGDSASTFIKGSNISVEGITFENSFQETGANGEQAVALSVTGNNVQFRNCRFLGNQDTLLLDGGTQYFTNCYIEGDVDFIFGRSQAVFEDSEIHSLNRGSSSNNGYIVAPRTSIDEAYGFAFMNCKLTAEEGTANNSVYLGRPWTPSGMSVDKPSAAFINCEMGAHIKTEPWTSMSGTPASHGRFFEYNSSGEGAVINASRPQLTQTEVANWTITNVLKGWEPSFSIKEEVKPEEPEVTPPVIEKIYFTDVTSTDAYYDDIMFLANNGYVEGVGNGQFAPLMEMTRSQFATILSRVLNLTTSSTTSAFTDVKPNAWYFNGIQACYEAGLIKGVSATSFAPNDKISKQDMMLLLSRAITYLNIQLDETQSDIQFIDQANISAYALDGIKICIQAGILKNEGYFIPKNVVTRADMATMFAKLIRLAN
ncbi:pectinesterase family protein [Cellulosilyticum lentocellum]|uniref:Pectinesterase n=1 Tax=Cellulosilyticum lentocellum (strain ATCC 49066 / DSM 5427 / NCIMB 11756 / RHM5) TaxID=642492 RepID=F2JKW9_CELLD|nr:pectinesterase family protein [Cellulosilyticum lentocellum]ADZ84510.1 Pectinesterase [Cellulosilyticum lentocellum DSM 5427]